MKIIQLVLDQMLYQGKKKLINIYLSICFLFSCDFENDFCRFSNLLGMELQFERIRAFQLIDNYAPERDHTLNNLAGSFIYVNTLNRVPNNKAQIKSSTYIPSNGCKVRFYYYMNSLTNPGQLTFLTRTETPGLPQGICSISKILGDYWERQELLLPTGPLSELLIEVKSLGGGGIIALDDISFSSQCNYSNEFLPYKVYNETTPKPPTCTYTCNDGTCIGQDKVKKKIDINLKINTKFFFSYL
jgi:hypothetical protein